MALTSKGQLGSVDNSSILELTCIYFLSLCLLCLIVAHNMTWFNSFFELKVDLIVILNADEDKKSNATYIISVARKLGCSIFLLPEDIIEVHSPVAFNI